MNVVESFLSNSKRFYVSKTMENKSKTIGCQTTTAKLKHAWARGTLVSRMIDDHTKDGGRGRLDLYVVFNMILAALTFWFDKA